MNSDYPLILESPMYDKNERISLWYFNWRLAFSEHPEARINITPDGRTQVRKNNELIIDRWYYTDDIDLNNWMGRMQIKSALDDYEKVNRG